MTAQTPRRLTLDQVVAQNIKKLRKARLEEANTLTAKRWTATAMAERLTEKLGRKYSRYTVADLEGRREREIRWVELAALCAIFDVALWDLVLPPEGVEVETSVTEGDVIRTDITDIPSDDPAMAALGATKGFQEFEWPQRDELALRFFSADAATIDSGEPRKYWERRNRERKEEAMLAIADAVIASKAFLEAVETEE